jgi:formylmethanofuran dehydrogenase subunit E
LLLIFKDGAVVTLLPNDLLEGAVHFHGHLGPFLILGLRAGLSGIDYLGKDYFSMRAKVETTLNPPHSCFIDGIQFSSGCTTGKGNLEVEACDGVSVKFVRGERRISIVVRNDVLEALDHLSDKQAETARREIMQKTDEELFMIEKG